MFFKSEVKMTKELVSDVKLRETVQNSTGNLGDIS
jgi:hypothetical protein